MLIPTVRTLRLCLLETGLRHVIRMTQTLDGRDPVLENWWLYKKRTETNINVCACTYIASHANMPCIIFDYSGSTIPDVDHIRPEL